MKSRCAEKQSFCFAEIKAHSTLIRPPLGDEILRACAERCVLEFFYLFFLVSVCSMQLVSGLMN